MMVDLVIPYLCGHYRTVFLRFVYSFGGYHLCQVNFTYDHRSSRSFAFRVSSVRHGGKDEIKLHQWESNYDLDPSLDPGVELPSTSNTTELLTPWLTLTTDGLSVQTHTPTPAKSPRRKADMLAIDEAQSLIVKGKRRR